jgi:Mrp family chromosome partitioning ATPase
MNRERTQDQILRDFLRLLRRQRVVVIVMLLVVTGVGLAYSLLKTPSYEASSQVQFNNEQENLSIVGSPVVPSSTPQVQVAAAARVINSPRVSARVASAPGIALSPTEVNDSVSTAVDPNTDLVTIATKASSAGLAARLANEFARQTKVVATRTERAGLASAVARVRRSLASGSQTPQERSIEQQNLSRLQSLEGLADPVSISSVATTPSSPASPRPLRDTVLALVLGMILGVLAAFVRDSFDRRLTDAHEIQHELQLPTVGFVGEEALGGVGVSQNGAAPGHDPGLEHFRILRSNVEFLAPDRKLKTIAITSPVAEEGKSTVAAGLATASALAGRRVLLVECDLRRPMLAERFKLSSQPGLSDWLTGQAEAPEVVQVAHVGPAQATSGDVPNAGQREAGTGALTVVAAGTFSPQPAELLALPRFREFLDQVVKVYDLVVLDCAPLLPVGDTLQVLPLADAALICIRVDQTTREQALAAKSAVEHFPPRPTGVVVTGVRPGGEGYYLGYYSYASRPAAVPTPGDPH